MSWRVHKLREPEKGFKLFVGVPDVGLVGPIAASFLIKNLKLDLVAYFDSDEIPPLLLFHETKPLLPVRVYGSGSTYVFVSEIAIPPRTIPSLARAIVDWAVSSGAEQIVVLSGIPVPNRIEIQTPRVYGAAVKAEDKEMLKKSGIELLREGFMSGVHAVVLKECLLRGVSGIALLAETYMNYPDPGAAASLVSTLGVLFGIKVDVSPLKEQEEEIRVKLRELMRRTMETMRQAGKEYEYTLPAMYA